MGLGWGETAFTHYQIQTIDKCVLGGVGVEGGAAFTHYEIQSIERCVLIGVVGGETAFTHYEIQTIERCVLIGIGEGRDTIQPLPDPNHREVCFKRGGAHIR